ncbi:sulfite exporter TauE/SafE family protein [Patescibacteria group bacterium]|nr:sulfite exporter TauE/SafE family protein [Patescibacteria group bacterium]
MLTKETFTIKGIHCKSCKTLIETEIGVLVGVVDISVDYINELCTIEFDNTKIKLDKIFSEITKLNYNPIVKGQHLHEIKQKDKTSEKENNIFNSFWFGLSVPLALLIIVGSYYFITKSSGLEIMSKLSTGEASLGIIFLIGILAGFHCVGMCGGLVISYTAKNAINKEGNIKQHLHYNLGRLVSYSIIGGILGGVGSFFGISPSFSGGLLLVTGFFMFIMGLSFVTGFPIFESIKLKTPQKIARYLYGQKHSKRPKGPFIVGLLNGFMPCGPLQAMQLYALASGSFFYGMTIMGIYALGTIPMMFGFGAFISKLGQNKIHKVIKLSGFLIIILGFIMINRGLINFELGFNFARSESNATVTIPKEVITNTNNQDVQIIKMKLGYYGYEPSTLYIKRGVPVRWVIDATSVTGCTNAIMIESLGIKKNLIKGENIIEFTPPSNVNEIKFSCWMRMVWGKFIVTD